MGIGYSKDRLGSVIDYFDVAGNRADAIADGTFDEVKKKVRESCHVFDVALPSWAQN